MIKIAAAVAYTNTWRQSSLPVGPSNLNSFIIGGPRSRRTLGNRIAEQGNILIIPDAGSGERNSESRPWITNLGVEPGFYIFAEVAGTH